MPISTHNIGVRTEKNETEIWIVLIFYDKVGEEISFPIKFHAHHIWTTMAAHNEPCQEDFIYLS